MDDQALEMISSRMKLLNLDSDIQTLNMTKSDSEKVETKKEMMVHEIPVSSESSGICSDQDQTLPIIRKIDDLSDKVMNLRKVHTVLCAEVKGITVDSVAGSEVYNTLQGLSEEHENLKKKYHEECQDLKNKYLDECSERKRLYNEVIELKGNIRVFCRCRPLNQNEIAKGYSSVVDFESSYENELQIIGSDSSRKQFKFDHVFRPVDTQEAVFIQTLPVVTSVLDGYNVCIFAYGQTGSGKTFTMEGSAENKGVNYRTLEELFRLSNERSTIMDYELSVSMLEVYNEKLRDLLLENSDQPPKKLEIKQSAEGTQEVPGLVEARVYNTDEVWELLKSGSRARSVGATNANELSSRSHCLLRVTVIGENLINGQRTRSHLWLVDLAGSERIGKIEVEGERLKESQFINKSLSALGDVISALASKTAHIPYRNSKLTHMLQSSLGGDCKTLMFVQISPSSSDLGETLCSLNFASRVRGVEHGPARKQADTSELFKYKQMAEKAKLDDKEFKKLQDNLQSFQLRLAAKEHMCKSLQEKVRELESQLAEERKTRQKQENRALAAVSSHTSASSTVKQALGTISEKRPPLGPSKLRLPLRRISNFLPQPPLCPPKTRASMLPISADDKENISRTSKAKTLMKPRRGSIAVRPPPSTDQVVIKPKRRASIATLRPEAVASNMMADPVNKQPRHERSGRKSYVWDTKRMWRTSKEHLSGGETTVEAAVTPLAAATRSSKFMGSPLPFEIGLLKPKNPTVIALQQRKPVVWTPLKNRVKANRKSFLPS